MTDETTLPGACVSNGPLLTGSTPAGVVTGKPSEDTLALITPSSAKSWSAMGPKLLLLALKILTSVKHLFLNLAYASPKHGGHWNERRRLQTKLDVPLLVRTLDGDCRISRARIFQSCFQASRSHLNPAATFLSEYRGRGTS